MSEWLDIGQLSDYLRIKSKTIYSMTRNGGLPSYKVNRLLRFKKSEIDEWMEKNKKPEFKQEEAVKRILSDKKKVEKAVDDIVAKAIESNKRVNRKTKPNRGHGKEKNHDTV